jgi:hypothetical protein
LDIVKAFDTTWYLGLVYKLSNLTQTIEHWKVGWLMSDEVEKIWKESALT